MSASTATKSAALRMVLVVIAFAGLLAACSSGNSSAGSAGGTAAPSSSAAAGSAGLAAAQAFVNQYSQLPKKINVTAPLPSQPPKHQKVIYLQGNTAGVEFAGDALKAAATALGWQYASVPYNAAEPATLQAAFQTALQEHPNMVYVMAAPDSTWGANTVSEYQKAGVKIVAGAIPTPKSPYVICCSNDLSNQYIWGELVGAEFIVASHGRGDAVMETVPSYPGLAEEAQGVKDIVAKDCSACQVDFVPVTIPQITAGQIPQVMVSSLRNKPNAKFLLFDYGPFSGGIDAALSAAGLSDVQVIGAGGSPEQFSAVKQGKELAWTVFNQYYQGWQTMDMYLRSIEGTQETAAELIGPIALLTKANVGNSDTAQWQYPLSYAQQFEKLWGIGQ
jgi:ABC-type sugar transport system substrate-binding protein